MAFEAQLADRERYFRALAQNASDVVTVCDADLRFTYVSPSATELVGYDPSEMVGRPATDFIHPDDQVVLAELAAELTAPDSTASARSTGPATATAASGTSRPSSATSSRTRRSAATS